ncbi:hypothetical protein C4Q31_08360 [Leptospira borgpetersenii serovar Ceylonica]|nr:hypothetical protein C4Q31_08360 [Leptospira borgpetersenii serovar Ceylonica]KGE24660.1 hypothetical protein IQ66_07145 [Leptospira borgpetersenii serovar Ballum]OOV46028.1 hypothetical protein B1H38_02280 [Leptospira borgpetersenii serovar Ballum]
MFGVNSRPIGSELVKAKRRLFAKQRNSITSKQITQSEATTLYKAKKFDRFYFLRLERVFIK